MDFGARGFVTYIVVLSYDQPNTFARVTCKHNLEPSISKNAPLSVDFLQIILNIYGCWNAPFQACFFSIIKLNLHMKHLKLKGKTELFTFDLPMLSSRLSY